MRLAAILFAFGLIFSGTAPLLAAETKPVRPARAVALPSPTSATAAAPKVMALDARLAGDHLRTRLIVDLSHKVVLAAFTLSDPYRVIVDLPEVTFDLPAGAGRRGRGLVSAYRYGLFAPGRARIVLDTSGPVAIDKAFVLEQIDDQPARLVIDLVRTDQESFKRTMATQTRTEMVSALAPAERKSDRETPAAPDHRPVIIIDPGHGGIDTGAIAPSGQEEKTIALAVAMKLREQLEHTGRFRAVLTRSDDTFIPLAERVQVARSNRASLFISIHADSISRREGAAHGATIYTVSDKASDAEAARLADKENKADLFAGLDLSEQSDEVANILFELTHRETKNFSGLFARTLAAQLKHAARLHKNPMKSAGFRVLRAPDVPSVLLELGYLSSREDVRLLASDAWRNKVAGAITEAVQGFFANRVAGIDR